MLRITNIWFVIKKKFSVIHFLLLSLLFEVKVCPDIYHILSLVLRFTFVNTRF